MLHARQHSMLASVACAPASSAFASPSACAELRGPFGDARAGEVELFEVGQPGEMLHPFVGDHGVAQVQAAEFLQSRPSLRDLYR